MPIMSRSLFTIIVGASGLPYPPSATNAAKFTGKYQHRKLTGGIGHNLPQEAPREFAQALLDVGKMARVSYA